MWGDTFSIVEGYIQYCGVEGYHQNLGDTISTIEDVQ